MRSQQIFVEHQVHAGVVLEPGLVLEKVCYKISEWCSGKQIPKYILEDVYTHALEQTTLKFLPAKPSYIMEIM